MSAIERIPELGLTQTSRDFRLVPSTESCTAQHGQFRASPAVWWCARARPRATATARWTTGGRTAATNGLGNRVINCRMNMGDATMLARGRSWKGGAENKCRRKRDCCLAKYLSAVIHDRLGCMKKPFEVALGTPLSL